MDIDTPGMDSDTLGMDTDIQEMNADIQEMNAYIQEMITYIQEMSADIQEMDADIQKMESYNPFIQRILFQTSLHHHRINRANLSAGIAFDTQFGVNHMFFVRCKRDCINGAPLHTFGTTNAIVCD